VLRVVSAQEGSDYEDDLGPVIEEAADLSQLLGEVWTDRLPAYRQRVIEVFTWYDCSRYLFRESQS
jgi:hypothetical protein